MNKRIIIAVRLTTLMLALSITVGASAQQEIENRNQGEFVTHLRSCRIGRPNPKFSLRRSRLLQGSENKYIGNRRQLVIFASFQDIDFKEDRAATYQKWDKIFNAEHYTEHYTDGELIGSIHDYFMDQSYGQFSLTFDLHFVKLPDNRYKYRSTHSDDENSQYMVDDIVDVLQEQDIDWSLYDWDGDSFVDQLLIVYAGKGMGAGGDLSCIWPHQWWLSQHTNLETPNPNDFRSYRTVVHGDKEYYVDCYCCVMEYADTEDWKSSFSTICHEYSHCFGFPDIYCGGSSVVGYWDLMDSGNLIAQGFRPCNYSAHERMLMGWLTPVELNSTTTITDMPSLDAEAVAYLIRNDGAENEFYMVENRQQRGWDEFLPASGIVVFHIDYDENLWLSTTEYVNGKKKRYWIIPANNMTSIKRSDAWTYPYVAKDVLGNDSLANDSLTNFSAPSAMLNNPNIDGTLLMSKPITRMSVDANGCASFVFTEETTTSVHDVLLHQEPLIHADPMYDLQGRRLSVPAKGLYIQGNKLRLKK